MQKYRENSSCERFEYLFSFCEKEIHETYTTFTFITSSLAAIAQPTFPAGEAVCDYNRENNAGQKHGEWIRVWAIMEVSTTKEPSKTELL